MVSKVQQIIRGAWSVSVRQLAALGVLGVLASGCGKPPGQPQPPPAVVTVAKPLQREVIEWDVYTGHLEAPEAVQVNSRVSGMLVAAPFKEGSVVKKDQTLFQIDRRPFQADYDARLADLAKAKAQVDVAKSNFDRESLALTGNAVSKQDYDNAKATLEQAQAALDGAKAALETSALNLEWCNVTSPISGRVSYRNVTVGNLVTNGGGPAPATLLTTVESVDPVYCYVDVDENSVLKYQKLAMARQRFSARDGRIPCYVQLANETNFPHEGFVDFVDNHVDTSTGTLRARGVFPNPTGDLTPGFFASMRVPGSGRYKALLIPDSAVMTDQDRRNVLVVGADNMVQPKPVELGALFGNLRAISSGLSPDDRVIINGQMHVQPGAPVNPMDGQIAINPSDFSEMGALIPEGQPSSEPAGGAVDRSQADVAAAELRKMESEGSAGMPTTQPQQPIMEYAKPSPNDVTDTTATSFSTPASGPSSGPAGAATGPATTGGATTDAATTGGATTGAATTGAATTDAATTVPAMASPASTIPATTGASGAGQ
jgi:RND family efflux transporter MFP subunit